MTVILKNSLSKQLPTEQLSPVIFAYYKESRTVNGNLTSRADGMERGKTLANDKLQSRHKTGNRILRAFNGHDHFESQEQNLFNAPSADSHPPGLLQSLHPHGRQGENLTDCQHVFIRPPYSDRVYASSGRMETGGGGFLTM